MDDYDIFVASSSDEGEQIPQSQAVDQQQGKQRRGRTWMSKNTKKKERRTSRAYCLQRI